MRLKVTFNKISVISWRSVLLVKEAEVSGENHRPSGIHWKNLTRNVNLAMSEIITPKTLVVIDTDCIGICKFNYHILTTTTA
jgi:hypothetical protein